MATARFGLFEFHSDTGELFREGRAVRLQAQPARLLALLIAARGEVVSRESLREALWPDGTHVDFDRGLNFAVAQVRSALGDSAESPAFIRTIPRKGYQFIAPLALPDPEDTVGERRGLSRRALYGIGLAAAVAIAGMGIAALRGSRQAEIRIAVARFANETGNADWDRFSGALTDSVVAGLALQTADRYGVIGNAAILLRPRSFQDLGEIASTLRAQYVILGQVQQDGPRVRVLAHLIRMPGETHVKVSRIPIDGSGSQSQVAGRIVADLVPALNSPAAVTR